MAIIAAARWRIERPRNWATPNSVTTLSTVFFSVVTTSPGASWATTLEIPAPVVEWSTTNPCPPWEYIAPRAKSAWPPLDE